LSRKPGTGWEYSNTAAGVLGYILADREKMTFDSLIKSKLTLPLDMYDTRIELTPQQAYKFIPGHNWNGDVTPHWTGDGDDVLAGCVLLRSTPQDMLKFASANLKPESTGISEVLKLSQTRHFNHGPYQGSSMGLGWVINDSDDLLFHDGGTYGFQSLLLVDRRNNIAVLVLTNSMLFDASGASPDNRPTEVGYQVLEYLRANN
jgi:serine-type D-Ala-D-Ala carboxypeptidase/endopeptidase